MPPFPRFSPRLLPAVAAVLLAACADDRPATAPPTDSRVERLLLVSVDGLRGDALGEMPILSSLLGRARWSDAVTTVVPSVTAPGHLAMLTGVDVTALGITSNELEAADGATLLLAGVTTLFAWTGDAGGRSAAVAGLPFATATQLSAARALLGLDTVVIAESNPAALLQTGMTLLEAYAVVFVHVLTVDAAGHTYGWIRPAPAGTPDTLGDAYRAAVRQVDAALGAAWESLAADVEAGRLAIVVTADHGGGHGTDCTAGVPAERDHCTAHDGDRLVPLVMIGAPFVPGPLPAGARLTQVAATLAGALAIRPFPSGAADAPLD